MQALKLALELENLAKYSNICIKYIFNIAVVITGKLDLVNKLLTAPFFSLNEFEGQQTNNFDLKLSCIHLWKKKLFTIQEN